ncbi:MAG: repair protein RadC [Sphingomonadales bacterium]|nr:repair protein RadC [Sphingomonadales bacterium]
MSEGIEAVRHLAALLATAWPEEADVRADALVAEFGSVAGVLAAPAEALRRCLGAEDGGIAAFLLSVRSAFAAATAPESDRPLLPSSEALGDFLRTGAAPAAGSLRILYLNARNLLVADETVGEDLPPAGTLRHGTILKRALERGATAIILVGRRERAEPEPEDLEETARLVRAAKTLDIVVHDRILIAAGGWRSFKHSGLLV